ncbi:hypothetical protein V6617_18600 (plasmid) [Pelagibacterium nitratireducens]|jgi:hypothetical protein|uniref:DUF7007 domain-containing protein n=1 Tax=Pelagibacterium nitratireducens TaxID=1046114 RepID=A0ABZ2IAH8_9HYPH|tara:strand:+ start:2295 stop:3161 length:867 start_codon:yes stop_codon:yes gene_type:complete
MTLPQTQPDSTAPPEVHFATSAEGFPVAHLGDTAFAMPAGHGETHFLATTWRVRRPLAVLVRNEFYGHGEALAGEEAFRAKVLEPAGHAGEKRALGRREIRSHANISLGSSQGATVFAEGVVCHSTARHGGLHLAADRNVKVDRRLRRPGGWYEEEPEWVIVALTFRHLFTSFERRSAEQTVKDSWSDAWEAIFGTVRWPGQSHEKDRRAFHARHAGDWIVISAIRSEQRDGYVEVVATLGGRRGPEAEKRRFFVPSAEYEIGRIGFLADPVRHEISEGPLSFVGWGR